MSTSIMGRTFDPVTKTWSRVLLPEDTRGDSVEPEADPPAPTPTPAGGSSNPATKQFRDVEKHILMGEGSISPETKLRAKTTATLEGLGKNVSGLFYVDSVTMTFSESEVSQNATFSRNALGSSVKSGGVPTDAPVVTETRKEEVVPVVQPRNHTIVKGDTLWGMAVKYYGSGNKYPIIADANNIPESDYKRLRIGRVVIIP